MRSRSHNKQAEQITMDGHGQQWEGKVQAHISSSQDQAWSRLSQFSNYHTLLPSLATCRLIVGVDGQPGCVRYCSSRPITTADGGQTTYWAKERLLSIDHVEKKLKYDIIESNMGFGKYDGTMAVVEVAGGGRCVLEWSFEAEPGPLVAMTRDRLRRFLENGIGDIGRTIDASRMVGDEGGEKKMVMCVRDKYGCIE